MKLPCVPSLFRSHRPVIIFTAALSFLGSLTDAGAAVIASDDFNSYAIGALAGNNGGTGWSNAYAVAPGTVNISAGGLSYSGGSININGGTQSVAVLGNSNNNSMI